MAEVSRGFSRERRVRERFPVSRATLWRWVREGRFPAPVKLGVGVTAWRNADLDAWEAQKAGTK